MSAYAQEAAARKRRDAVGRSILLALPGAIGWFIFLVLMLLERAEPYFGSVGASVALGWGVGLAWVSLPLSLFCAAATVLALFLLRRRREASDVWGAFLAAAVNVSFAVVVGLPVLRLLS